METDMNGQVHAGAYGVLLNATGSEILLIRKSRGPYTGLLDLPGGRIEPGESPEDTVRRKFGEETGLDLQVEGRLGNFDRTVTYSPAGGDGQVRLHHTGVIFHVALTRPDQVVKTDSDGQDSLGALWVDIEGLQENSVSPLVATALALLGGSPARNMPSVLYHGSPHRIERLEPRPARGVGPEHDMLTAVYATDSRNIAIAFAMSGTPDEDGNLSWDLEMENDRPIISYRAGHPRAGQSGFVYSLSPEGFQKAAAHQWVSFSPVTPISCETIRVDDYLGWVKAQP
jgi:ADP-ribose pyrophosphatase YjhB (NUDIX family)